MWDNIWSSQMLSLSLTITNKIYIMFKNITTSSEYPKTLVIRNTKGGMIWQIYHVNELYEADRLSFNATKNGFESCTLEDYHFNHEETFVDWRKESDWVR